MNIIRLLGRGLLLTIVTMSVGLLITVLTLQSTALNREAVKGWLVNSGAYEHILSSAIRLESAGAQEQTFDQEALHEAIYNTLTPTYIKQVTETGLNAIYDWLEGKASTISFSIPVNDKRPVLQQNLQTALEPYVKDLPACSSSFSGLSSQQVNCLPPSVSVQEAAAKTAEQIVQGSDFLTKPVTQDEALGQLGLQHMSWLPTLVQGTSTAVITLPVLAILCGIAYVFLGDQKLASLRTLMGHLFFSTGLAAVVGAAAWYFGGTIKFDQALVDESVLPLLQNVIQPIVHQVIPSIGFWLLVFAGSAALLSGATWVVLLFATKRHAKPHYDNEPEPSSPAPVVENKGVETPAAAPKPEATETKPESKPPKTIGRM